MPEYLAPGVYVEEVPVRSKSITGVGTSTAAFIGLAKKGPLDHARLITSYADFEEQYGKPVKGQHLAPSAQLFFTNGGTRLYIARVDSDMDSSQDERSWKAAFGLLNDIDDVSLIAAPGAGTTSMIEFASDYCHKRKDCFFIADLLQTVDNVTEAQQAIRTLRNKSSYTALYFPWVQLTNRNSRLAANVPPSGAVAGVYARTDASRGFWKAPAGLEAIVQGVTNVAVSISDKEQDLVNPVGINVIRKFVPQGILTWGARTLTETQSEYRYVPVRRTAIFIEQSIIQGTQWAVFEPNDANLWGQLKSLVSTFMQGLFREGAFQGSKPDDAYFVKCDHETTTQSDISNGVVNIQIGFAPLKPAEFTVINIQQKAGHAKTL